MNTFLGDNPKAYTGLGILDSNPEELSMSGKIGAINSIQGGFGLRLNTNENGQSERSNDDQSAWVLDDLGNVNINATIIEESVSRANLSNNDLAISIGKQLGVYRPNLEDRKVGKVGMHMVIDGFPRALREVAKVMTWAADVKGYKLHDWRNLPNADVDFPAAEYRHQSDNCIMKAEGTPAIERTDHESNLLHAAHKVFNSLAELELILTGVIK